MKTEELIKYLKDLPNLMECDKYEKRLHEEIIKRLEELEELKTLMNNPHLTQVQTWKAMRKAIPLSE